MRGMMIGAAAAAALTGAIVAATLPYTAAVDSALPFWAAVPPLAAIVARRRARNLIVFGTPLILLAALFLPDARLRWLTIGVIFGASLLLAGYSAISKRHTLSAAAMRRGTIRFEDAAWLLLLALAPRLIPFGWMETGALALVLAGTIAILGIAREEADRGEGRGAKNRGEGRGAREEGESKAISPLWRRLVAGKARVSAPLPREEGEGASEEGTASDFPSSPAPLPSPLCNVPPDLLMVVAAFGLLTPLVPLNASLYPLAIAVALLAATRRLPALAIIAVAAGWMVGRWGAAGAAVVAAAGWVGVGRLGVRGVVVPPIAFGAARAAAGAIAFAPVAFRGWLTASLGTRLAAAALLALSAFARPLPAFLLASTALILGVLGSRVSRLSLVTALFSLGLFSIAAWNGIVAASFPAAMPPTLWGVMAIGGAVALLIPTPVATSAVAAATAILMFAMIGGAPAADLQQIEASLAAGESIVVRPQRSASSFAVVVSGANVADLEKGTLAGSLRVVDASGHGWSRRITIGDLADWGAFREGFAFRTRNTMPKVSSWELQDEGRTAWLRGEGRVEVHLERPAAAVEIRAAESLSPGARLLIRRLEVYPPW
ncbi:MAG TPA: hypothetical protein VM557_08770 [Thermoanaerobaculia bacterium]|nr:hypothetical protein [Thermoanaerobaculia bacterium]